MNILRKIIRKAKNAQLVSFRPEHETLHETGYVPPRPAKYYVPDWYRKIPQTVNKQQGINPVTQEKQHTVKACVPVLDAFTSGYIQELNMDIDVQRAGGRCRVILLAAPKSMGASSCAKEPSCDEWFCAPAWI